MIMNNINKLLYTTLVVACLFPLRIYASKLHIDSIGYYLYKLVKENYKLGFFAFISLVFAGAVVNIIDSIFYGVIFDHSFGQLATFMPEGGGYASWLHGKVVKEQ